MNPLAGAVGEENVIERNDGSPFSGEGGLFDNLNALFTEKRNLGPPSLDAAPAGLAPGAVVSPATGDVFQAPAGAGGPGGGNADVVNAINNQTKVLAKAMAPPSPPPKPLVNPAPAQRR